MKLQTEIKPRRDGVVTLVGEDGKSYVFKADETGALVCDVDHELTIVTATRSGNFFPAFEEDEAAVMALAEKAAPIGDVEDDGEEEEPNPDAPPIETLTPPKEPKPPKGPKGHKHSAL